MTGTRGNALQGGEDGAPGERDRPVAGCAGRASGDSPEDIAKFCQDAPQEPAGHTLEAVKIALYPPRHSGGPGHGPIELRGPPGHAPLSRARPGRGDGRGRKRGSAEPAHHPEDAVRNFKLLSTVEPALRPMKTIDLKVRPIHHHLVCAATSSYARSPTMAW